MTFHSVDENSDGELARKLSELENVEQSMLLRAQALAESEKMSLARAVLKLGFVDEETLISLLSEHLKLERYSTDTKASLDETAVQRLSLTFCKSHVVAPVLLNDGSAKLVMGQPENFDLLREIEFFLGEQRDVVSAPSRVVKELLNAMLVSETRTDAIVSEAQLLADQTEVKRLDGDGPVIRFVSSVFDSAVERGASDVHFEAQDGGLRVRLRINGTLQTQSVPTELSPAAIFARVKVVASMNVSERRLPQDGRITTNIAGRKIDFRVSSVPTSFGESIVCRVLDPNALRLGWEKLGFDKNLAKDVVNLIEQPSGLFLVTGPTGSGKTTTLYTALSHLNDEKRKILTVEDPIEYNLKGIEQVQVHEEVGMTFARALRSFLRQDPNIIMVGEIRDEETAEIACRAALVGRMVLSTMHTNSPKGATTRLTDLGVPEYIVKDVLRGVLGQSLEAGDRGKRRLVANLHIPKQS